MLPGLAVDDDAIDGRNGISVNDNPRPKSLVGQGG